MPENMTPEERTAATSADDQAGRVTLINCFTVACGPRRRVREDVDRDEHVLPGAAGVRVAPPAPRRDPRSAVPLGQRRRLGIGSAVPGRAIGPKTSAAS